MKKPVGRPKIDKETKEIMEMLYNFHGLLETVKYEKFCERSYIGEFHANCSISGMPYFVSVAPLC